MKLRIYKNISKLEKDYHNMPYPDTFNKLTIEIFKLEQLFEYKLQEIIVRSRARWVGNVKEYKLYFKPGKTQ